jgi:uncharacterized membrane protein YhiD involved in acid resistance
MLVCVGATLFMITSAVGFSDVLNQAHVVLDPSRVAAQVASGIGFLGAGTIILRRRIVHGLTTAASIWSVAAVGLAVGGGLYVPAAGATCIIVTILAGLRPLERHFFAKAKTQTIVLEVAEWPAAPVQLLGLCERHGVVLQALKIQAKAATPTGRVELTIAGSLSRVMALLSAVNTDSRVKEIGAVMYHL